MIKKRKRGKTETRLASVWMWLVNRKGAPLWLAKVGFLYTNRRNRCKSRRKKKNLLDKTTHSLIVAIIPCWDSISSLRADSCFWWASRWLIICFSSADCNKTHTVWIKTGVLQSTITPNFFFIQRQTLSNRPGRDYTTETLGDTALPRYWILRNVQFQMTWHLRKHKA